MVRFENQCCSCAVPAYPCLGSSCPNRNVPVLICDKCKDEVEELFWWDDTEQWCIDCIKENLEKVTID